jgi:hypothetical protein
MAGISGIEWVHLLIGPLIWAEVLGVSVVWVRARREKMWGTQSKRRRLQLLSEYVRPLTTIGGAWGAVVAVAALISSNIA